MNEEKEYELIEILKNGICPHTGKRYNCLRCNGAKPHDLMNQGVHIGLKTVLRDSTIP